MAIKHAFYREHILYGICFIGNTFFMHGCCIFACHNFSNARMLARQEGGREKERERRGLQGSRICWAIMFVLCVWCVCVMRVCMFVPLHRYRGHILKRTHSIVMLVCMYVPLHRYTHTLCVCVCVCVWCVCVCVYVPLHRYTHTLWSLHFWFKSSPVSID
jgi:hypothetical protein